MNARNLFGVMAAVLFSLTAGASHAQNPAAPAATSAAAPAVATSPPSTGKELEQPSMRDDKETIAAAQKWLALLDTGKAGAAWDVSSKHLQSIVTRAEWIKGIANARKPFGKFQSRSAEKFARAHALPGAPDGDYSIVEFESVFANGKKAAEQVVWMFEDGDVWRVSGYFIR